MKTYSIANYIWAITTLKLLNQHNIVMKAEEVTLADKYEYIRKLAIEVLVKLPIDVAMTDYTDIEKAVRIIIIYTKELEENNFKNEFMPEQRLHLGTELPKEVRFPFAHLDFVGQHLDNYQRHLTYLAESNQHKYFGMSLIYQVKRKQ